MSVWRGNHIDIHRCNFRLYSAVDIFHESKLIYPGIDYTNIFVESRAEITQFQIFSILIAVFSKIGTSTSYKNRFPITNSRKTPLYNDETNIQPFQLLALKHLAWYFSNVNYYEISSQQTVSVIVYIPIKL